jgi:hypothetical protein
MCGGDGDTNDGVNDASCGKGLYGEDAGDGCGGGGGVVVVVWR